MAFENQAKMYCWQIARSTYYCIVDKSLALRLSLYRSIQRKKLYSRMSNVLLNSSILAIYGLWKSSEIGQIVLLTNRSQYVRLTNHSQYVS